MRRADGAPGPGSPGSSTTERGQATLEFVLCLPLLLLLLAALVEVSLIASDQVRLWHAAREAARAAAVEPDPEAALAAARRTGLAPLEARISPDEAFRAPGAPVTVTLSYGPDVHVPLLAALLDRLRLSAAATMRIEQP